MGNKAVKLYVGSYALNRKYIMTEKAKNTFLNKCFT
jgi:hypothetical protein